MDYQESIETLQDIHDVAESRIKNGDARGVVYIPRDKLDDLKTAISAMQELQKQNDDICVVTNLPCCRCQLGACENRRRNDGLSGSN